MKKRLRDARTPGAMTPKDSASMHAKRTAVLLIALVALLLPATAVQGAVRTPIGVALGKAQRLWGVKPCAGHYSVQFVRAIEGNPDIGGQARFDTPTGRGFYTSPMSTWTGCELLLRRADWSRWSVETNWPQLCTEVLHEWGHLTGHVHTDPTAQEVAEAASYGWTYGNAPGVPPDTPEQTAVMRSGSHSYSSDFKRCGIHA